MAVRWTCPFCRQKATVGNDNRSRIDSALPLGKGHQIAIEVTRCFNPDCQQETARAILLEGKREVVDGVVETAWYEKSEWRLIPISRARSWPDYVPKVIREDYEEACSIESASPKASAALSRRCLQGLIRDYYGVSKERLIDEINELADSVGDDVLKALHALRGIGNIGAHPERDPAVIVEIEPGEATAMIDLIELLILETYIARDERQRRLTRVDDIAKAKASARAATSPQSTP